MHLAQGNDRKLAVALPTADASPSFKLPRGWTIQKVLRRDRSQYDMCYIEEGTGMKFKSTKEVERYLSVEGSSRRSNHSYGHKRRHTSIKKDNECRTMVVPGGKNYGHKRPRLSVEKDSECRRMIVSGGKVFSVEDESEINSEAYRKASRVLPDGWIIEEVPRHNKHTTDSDKYYYEPGTGMKFRSTREVERYLNGGEGSRRGSNHNIGYQGLLLSAERDNVRKRMIISGGKLFSLEDETEIYPGAYTKACDVLPDGWIVEVIPRHKRHNSHGDTYYYEPETGKKFRSLSDVKKHLEEMEEEENSPLSTALEKIQENIPLSKAFKLGKSLKNSRPSQKCICGENSKNSSFIIPPMKVDWVLASPRGDSWNVFISETLVEDSQKKQWSDQLAILMNNGD